MKIYTGFGDEGNTALFGGKVVKKNDIRIEIYGTLDELNSAIGLLRAKNSDQVIDDILNTIQEEIFILSSEIATPDQKRQNKLRNQISVENIKNIEKIIDDFSDKLKPLKNFILPGGSESASIAHLARTICRRTERKLTDLITRNQIRKEIVVYINRLSDLLFVLARYLNKLNNVADNPWLS
jgi:cob(I)alamin adenosyltransferase